jgi:FkbM family methyltransferase
MSSQELVNIRVYGCDVTLSTSGEEDHISRTIARTKAFYESDLLDAVRRVYWPGTIILDVGAYIGNHTVFFAKVVGAYTHAFEPNPVSADCLERNVVLNGLEDVVSIHRVAVGSSDGKGFLKAGPPTNLGETRVEPDERGDVTYIKLDDLELSATVGILKVDTEGHEAAVVSGARALIRRDTPDLFLELSSESHFHSMAQVLCDDGYVPVARYCATPTYHFRHIDQVQRMKRLLGRSW